MVAHVYVHACCVINLYISKVLIIFHKKIHRKHCNLKKWILAEALKITFVFLPLCPSASYLRVLKR